MKPRFQAARWVVLCLFLVPAAIICWRELAQRQPQSPAGRGAFQTVVIDPGHGGVDTGALGKGLREKDLTLSVALELARLLRAEGLHVVLTRKSDTFVSLGQRVQIANAERNSIFVSIHFNQTGDASANGIETYLASDKSWKARGFFPFLPTGVNMKGAPSDAALALSLQEELISATRATDRGVKDRNFYVIRHVTAPAVLVEGGFVSNARSASRLQKAAYRESLAEALARGIYKYREGKTGTQTLLAKRSE